MMVARTVALFFSAALCGGRGGVQGIPGTGNLVTLAERMTRFVLFARAATKEADGVASAVTSAFSRRFRRASWKR